MNDNPHQVFEYEDFIRITSQGGNIGRFFWANQNQFTIEVWENDSDPWDPDAPLTHLPNESVTSELPGSAALVATLGDWWAWVMFP